MNRIALLRASWLALPSILTAQPSTLVRLEVFPATRVLHAPHGTQQLAVTAHYTDGTQRDVTQLTRFLSTDYDTATVTRSGRVQFHKAGAVAIVCRYHTVQSVRLTYVDPKPGFVWPSPPEHNRVDRLVFARLKELSLAPADLCSEVVFLRRAYHDVCGIWPTPREIKRYMEDERIDRRKRLIDELLERPEYAERWAHHWGEMLALPFAHRHPMQARAYLDWLRAHVRHGTPLDEMARQIVIGNGVVTELGPASFYTGAQEPADWGGRLSQAFLGIRLQCYQCHALETTRWTSNDWHGYAAFFAQIKPQALKMGNWQIDMILLDPQREMLDRVTLKPITPRFLDGVTPRLKPGQDRRTVLADWLTSPRNRYFARTMANRIWHQLLGKAIADPPEMLHELPLTANDELLDMLAQDLIANRYDARPIIRLIMNSRTYQLSSEKNKYNQDDEKYFSRSYPSPVPTVVHLDGLTQLLEVPLAIENTPFGTRAVQVLHAGPNFVVNPRRRYVCEAEEKAPNLAANLHLLNSEWIQALFQAPHNRIGRLLREKKTDREIVDEIFLAALAREPKADERKLIAEHLARTKNRRQTYEDLTWSLVNTKEFLRRP